MSGNTEDTLREQILAKIEGAGEEGLSISDLRTAEPESTDRKLRYRLGKLQEEGAIEKIGKGRATRYISCALEDSSLGEEPPTEVPFSRSSRRALDALGVPASKRPIAHYMPDWITEMGAGSLLTERQRTHLMSLGATGFEGEPAGTYARQVYERLLIDLSWASSALEGNTYTLLDTQRLIALGLEAHGKQKLEAQMIMNHKRAIEFLFDAVEYGMVRMVVSNLHAILMENLLPDPSSYGRVRRQPVRITGSSYLPLDPPSQIEEELERILSFARQKEDAFERASFLLLALPYLQPFIDGNKRTARLIANLPLFIANVRPLSFVDIPRADYLRATLCTYEQRDPGPLIDLFVFAYERSCARYPDVIEALSEPDPFRLEHRDLIYDAIFTIVTSLVSPVEPEVDRLARAHFSNVEDRATFAAFVLTDLAALHEGNFMRYRLRPSQFEAWRAMRGG